MTRDVAHEDAERLDATDPGLVSARQWRDQLTGTLDADTFGAFEDELLRGIDDGLDETAAWDRAWQRVVGPLPDLEGSLPPRERTVRAQRREAAERFRD